MVPNKIAIGAYRMLGRGPSGVAPASSCALDQPVSLPTLETNETNTLPRQSQEQLWCIAKETVGLTVDVAAGDVNTAIGILLNHQEGRLAGHQDRKCWQNIGAQDPTPVSKGAIAESCQFISSRSSACSQDGC